MDNLTNKPKKRKDTEIEMKEKTLQLMPQK